MSGKVDDLVAYLIVTLYKDTSIDLAHHVMHREGLQSTVTFILKVRGEQRYNNHIKTTKFCFGDYCTGNRSIPYAHPEPRVLGPE